MAARWLVIKSRAECPEFRTDQSASPPGRPAAPYSDGHFIIRRLDGIRRIMPQIRDR